MNCRQGHSLASELGSICRLAGVSRPERDATATPYKGQRRPPPTSMLGACASTAGRDYGVAAGRAMAGPRTGWARLGFSAGLQEEPRSTGIDRGEVSLARKED